MFGTALATSPLMASNFIGTRVFTLGLYSNTFAKDLALMVQNSKLTSDALSLDPINISQGTIRQNHKLDDVPIASQSFIKTTTIKQNQVFVPLSQYLRTFSANNNISQKHVMTGADAILNIFAVSGRFNQRHVITPKGMNLLTKIADGTFKQNNILVSVGQYLRTFAATNSLFKQNHRVYGDALKLDAFIQPVTFRQNHKVDAPDLVSFYDVQSTGMIQTHIMVSLGQYSTIDDAPIGSFGQNHIVVGNQLDMPLTTISDPTDFYQQHLLIPDYLKVEPLEVGKPFVNPSIRRSVVYTGDSTNVMVMSVEQENSVVIFSADRDNFALVLDLATNKYT